MADKLNFANDIDIASPDRTRVLGFTTDSAGVRQSYGNLTVTEILAPEKQDRQSAITAVKNSIATLQTKDAQIESKLGVYDFTQVDDNVTFVLDGDAEKEMASLIQATPSYNQDAIMLSLEPIIPTSDTHNFGIKGQIAIDSDHLYICVADNEWKKIPLQYL